MLRAGLCQHRKRAGVAFRAEGCADRDRVEARAVIEIHELVIGMRAGLAVLRLDKVEDELLVVLDEVVEAQQDRRAIPLTHADAGIFNGAFYIVGGGNGEAKEFLAGKRRVSMVFLAGAAYVVGGIGVQETLHTVGETGLSKGFHDVHCPKNIWLRYTFFEICLTNLTTGG